MQRRWTWVGGLFLGLACWLTLAQLADAVIIRLTPLRDVLKENDFIVIAKVEKLLPEKPAMLLTVSEHLKGKLAYERLPVNLKGNAEAEKNKHVPEMLKRLAPDLPIVLFANQRGKKVTFFGYTNGTWFHMLGEKAEEGKIIVTFQNAEPFLRRTFKGTTAELVQILRDGLDGKKDPPEPNDKEPPGYGPEVAPAKQGSALPPGNGVGGGRLFAVIPTIGIGGPLAILALLFPSLFGGVYVLFRQWMAFFTIISLQTVLLVAFWIWGDDFVGSWWGTQTALWLGMTTVVLAGVLWAWRRHLNVVENGDIVDAPLKTEIMVLLMFSAACVGMVVCYFIWPPPSIDAMWAMTFTMAAGVWLGTLYKIYRGVLNQMVLLPRMDLPTEGVILWGCLAASLVYLTMMGGQTGTTSELADTGGADGKTVQVAKIKSQWLLPLNKEGSGMVVSAPRVVGDHVFVAVAHTKGLDTFGAVYCVDRSKKAIVWTFDDDAEMKQIYSSPFHADGRIYIGEGFHQDKQCKLYCIDARTGKKLWHFQTNGQTESSPVVANGKVYFGAGNEGLYCVDAQTGKQLWRYGREPNETPLFRICSGPAISGHKLYVGSGVDRDQPDNPGETAIVCLDADTGKQHWKTLTSLPAWASPVVASDYVYCGVGNGDILTEAKHPAGHMLCLHASTGKEAWQFQARGGILDKPAFDARRLFFGARDGNCYCLDRFTGKLLWKRDLGSPVVAAPVVDATTTTAATCVFTIATKGQVSCLDAASGKAHWTYHDLVSRGAHLSAAPTLAVQQRAEGARRQLFFAASLNNNSLPALVYLEDLLPAR